MLVFGLTGPSGAGKSTVSELFASYGIPVINADDVYHALLVPPSDCLGELVMQFGHTVLRKDGTLDRQRLGQIVFNDENALRELNRITHRYVMEKIREELSALRRKNVPAAVFDAPQLFEAGAERECNVIVSVLSDRNLRIERIIARDGIDYDAAMRRIMSQRSDEFFRNNSDYIIENNSTPEYLAPQVRKILSETGVLGA